MSIRKEVIVRAVTKRRVAAPGERGFRLGQRPNTCSAGFSQLLMERLCPCGGRPTSGMTLPHHHAHTGGRYYRHGRWHLIMKCTRRRNWCSSGPGRRLARWLRDRVTVELHDIQGETEVIITHEPRNSDWPRGHTIGWNCALERFVLLVEERAMLSVSARAGDPAGREGRRQPSLRFAIVSSGCGQTGIVPPYISLDRWG